MMMEDIKRTIETLQLLRRPSDLSFHYGGSTLAATVCPAFREIGQSIESRIWCVTTENKTEQLTFGPGADATPRFSPVNEHLVFTSDRLLRGRMSLFLYQDEGEAVLIGEVPGSIEEVRWNSEGTALFVLSADRGLDCAPTSGATRLWWGDEADPDIRHPDKDRRRLYRVMIDDGSTVDVGPKQYTIWDFDLLNDRQAVALVSEDTSERGWYRAHLALLDLKNNLARTLYEPSRQLQNPVVDPSGRRVAVLEGWASDRGLLAGPIRTIDLDTSDSTLIANETIADVAFVQWIDPESLWFAGWHEMGSIYGVVGLDGIVEWSQCEDAILGISEFSAKIAPAPDGSGLAAVRESVQQVPEVVYRKDLEEPWRLLSAFNEGTIHKLRSPEVLEVEWQGQDDLPIRGLLLLPPDRPNEPSAMVVMVHGGPTSNVKYAVDPGNAIPLVSADYAVFLPNYRGSVGRGQEFTCSDLRDPGGAEFQDILRGVDWCVDQGIADSAQIGITGVSYGGYLTAWAVATCERFNAAVMISGISNLLSCHFTCNHAFCEFIVGGSPTEIGARDLMVERSPVFHVAAATTPTLILHGADDRCTPLGQAEEFYRALANQGVQTQLVIYPREGHGFQQRKHQIDAQQRIVAWFDKFLRGLQ